MQLVEDSVVLSGSLSSLWPASFGLFACLDFGLKKSEVVRAVNSITFYMLHFRFYDVRPFTLVPCFFFSPFLWCFLFIKFGRVSSSSTLCGSWESEVKSFSKFFLLLTQILTHFN
jgi:hypothetical protein